MVDLFVALPGAPPVEVENRVTLSLEKRMWEIPVAEYVYSTSMPGLAMVKVRFEVGDFQSRRVRDRRTASQVRRGSSPAGWPRGHLVGQCPPT